MNSIKLSTRLGLVALAMVCLLAASSVAGAHNHVRRVHLTFDKTAVPDQPGVWRGTVAGDINGDLESRLLRQRGPGPIFRVTFDWIVSARGHSFTARARGTLNTETGAVSMRGRVIRGYLRGARFVEEGQLVDPATSRFQGTITLIAHRRR